VTLRDSRVLAIAGLLAVLSCNEPSLAPGAPQVRDVLYLHGNGSLYLVNTNGMNRRPVGPAGLPAFLPLAVSADGRTIALLQGNQIALALVEDLSARQLIYAGRPDNTGPAAFSDDDRRLAIPCYMVGQGPAVLLFDRSTQHWDTVIVGAPGFTMGPAFSPDGSELAGLGETDLGMFAIRVRLSDLHVTVDELGASRFLNLPVFGWPRWTREKGFMFLARRGITTQGPDTLAVESFDPDYPTGGVRKLYSVLQAPDSSGPDLVFGGVSTYSLSQDGDQVILTAFPDTALTYHGLWAAAKGGRRVYSVLGDPTQFLLYPQLLH
jgi:hypothetical protein